MVFFAGVVVHALFGTLHRPAALVRSRDISEERFFSMKAIFDDVGRTLARRQRPKVSGALLKERTMRWCVSQEADALHGQAI